MNKEDPMSAFAQATGCAASSACGPILDAAGLCVGWFNRRRGLELIECEKRAADEIISRYHYSKKPTKNSFCSLLVMRRGVSLGAIQLGYGIRPKIKSGDSDTIREFDRMWLSDELPRFTETVILSMLHRFIAHRFPEIETLVSYADTSAGNTGTIYRAAGYKEEGKVKADFYILATGERVHPVSMWHRHGTRAWNFMVQQYPGIRKADGFQLRFSKKMRRLKRRFDKLHNEVAELRAQQNNEPKGK